MVGEVKLELKQRRDFQQLVTKYGQVVAEVTFELRHGYFMSRFIGRRNEVCHGFCLTKVHFSIEVSALSVFSGCSLATAFFNKYSENRGGYERRPMA